MKTIKYTISLLICFLISYSAHAQYFNKGKTGVSILLEGTTSAIGPGITPSITLGNDCHELQIGPRILFQSLNKATRPHDKMFALDVGYRLYYFHSRKGFSFYASFKNEIAKFSGSNYWMYDPVNPPSDWRLDFGLEQTEIRSDYKEVNVNLHLGPGLTYEFFNGIYLKAEGAYGISILSENAVHHVSLTNEAILSTATLMDIRYHSWVASAGVGFRF